MGRTLRGLVMPPRGDLADAEYLALRLVTNASLILAALGLVTVLTFPVLAGFEPVNFVSNLGATLGLVVSYALAMRGRARLATNILLAVITGAIGAIVLRNQGDRLHDVFVMAILLPITLGFMLGRARAALAILAATLVYLAGHVAWVDHDLVEVATLAILLVGGTAVSGLGPVLREKETRRAVAAEEASRRLTQSLQEAQQIARLGSWDYDFTTRQALWSPEMYRLFGRDPATFNPKMDDILAAVHPDDRAGTLAAFEAASRQGAPWRHDHRVLHDDGTVLTVEQHARFVQGPDGRPLRAAGTTQDISDRIQAEAARREAALQQAEVRRLQDLNRMRMEFLNMAAHDLKTPLTPLKLAVATLKRQSDRSPKQSEHLELLDRNVQRFELLVEDLLDAARLQAGRLQLRLADVDLAAAARESVAAFQEAAAKGGIELEADLPETAMVRVDALRVMQVCMNLVSNAVQYTPHGGRVRVALARQGPWWRLEVHDTGLGLTPEQRERLFQPFMRLHEGPGVPRGTGLGLYISKGIVEQHGGAIGAESAGRGQGSTFHARFPAASPPTVGPAGNPGPAPATDL